MGEHEGDLAEAEREFRQAVPNSWGDTEVADWALVTLLAEYNRRGSALASVEAERDALRAARDRVLEACQGAEKHPIPEDQYFYPDEGREHASPAQSRPGVVAGEPAPRLWLG